MFRFVQTLLKGRQSLGSLFDTNGAETVILLDRAGRFERISTAAEALLHEPVDLLVGRTLADFVAPASRPAVLGALQAAIGRGEAQRVDAQIYRGDGTLSTLEISLSIAGSGAVWGILRDVTAARADAAARERSLQQARESEAAKTDYFANLSHELRTPLNAIIGFAEMMDSETFGPLGHDKYREYVRLIGSSGQHLQSLVTDLLDLTKIEAGQYDLTLEPTDIGSLLHECVEMVRVEAETAGLTMELDVPTDLPMLNVDSRAVRQMVLNLLSNAVKFTGEGSVRVTPTFTPGEAESTLSITVTDTGVGMSAEDLARIGDRFRQAHREGVRGARGTGLGLSLTAGLARLHGGELSMKSIEGQGTDATLRLSVDQCLGETDMPGTDDGDLCAPQYGIPDRATLEALTRQLTDLAS